MELLDQTEIIASAREMRAREIRRRDGQIGKRLRLVPRLAAASLTDGLAVLAEIIRPFFAWNPREHRHS